MPDSERSDAAQAALKDSALHYHRFPKPGKLEVVATKPLANQRDLALAYSPGGPTAPPCSASAPSARLPPSR
jgi:malate dehydrogenase (oxaloacetate-decarboxylating)(NADP+)